MPISGYQYAINCYLRSGFPLPAEPLDVARYLEEATVLRKTKGGIWKATDKPLSISSCVVVLSALSFYHRQEHYDRPDPTQHELVRRAMEAIRKERARPLNKARAVSLEELHRMVDAARKNRNETHRYRDAALMLIGFYGAFRRSELVGIRVEHLKFEDGKGVSIFLPKSKTDPGHGASVPIPEQGGEYCPVAALRVWLTFAVIARGPVFRAIDRWGWMPDNAVSADVVTDTLRKYARKAGVSLDKLRSHSLRAGCITETLRADGGLEDVAEHARHRNPSTTLGYYRRDDQTRLEDAPTRLLAQPAPEPVGWVERLKRLFGVAA